MKAWKGDTEGNLVYRKTARNHNPAVATAGRVTIAEVEQLVPAGELEPDEVHMHTCTHARMHMDRDLLSPRAQVQVHTPGHLHMHTHTHAPTHGQVHTPGIYVQRVVQGERMGVIERLTLADAPSSFSPETGGLVPRYVP